MNSIMEDMLCYWSILTLIQWRKEMEKIELFSEKADCCACGACMNICPKHAISMVEDEYGFKYPSINEELCIRCGVCKSVCGYQNKKETNEPLHTYVACTQTTNIVESASGGVFAALAKAFLEKGGIVYGVALEQIDGELVPLHIGIERKEDLHKLLGSKYVQSNVGTVYAKIKMQLHEGRRVMFSGSPCQVAGLKAYLGNKEYDNLILIDIICHGVPSIQFFNSYLHELEKKLKGRVVDFKFRDKSKGWGLVSRVDYINASNKPKSRSINARESSYYHLFLAGDIYRENCYSCKYASKNRPGDITLGDYWGIEKEHPEYLTANGGVFDERKGVSCMILSTEKAKAFVEEVRDSVQLQESTFEKAARKNGQLVHPTPCSERREKVLEMYADLGYKAIDKWFIKKLGIKMIPIYIIDRIPVSLKKGIRRILK